MYIKGLKMVFGSSWIEIESKVHTFVTRDRKHDQNEEIYAVLGLYSTDKGDPSSKISEEILRSCRKRGCNLLW